MEYESFSRGKLAKRTGVKGETIRYYEKIGLLQAPARSASGHRIFDQTHLSRIWFIRRCRELGFSIKEIQDLILLVASGEYTCTEIRDKTQVHLTSVEKKLADLQKMQSSLKDMISHCDGGLTQDCSIVDILFSSEDFPETRHETAHETAQV